jgi:prevent-host-death family protein
MDEVGVRELKTYASEIVHKVQEQRARYLITHRGKPVAMLVPIEQTTGVAEAGMDPEPTAWDELLRLGEEISQGWQSQESSLEILSKMRC